MDESDRPSVPATERARAALRKAGIVLPESELAELADGLRALERLLETVRTGRPEP